MLRGAGEHINIKHIKFKHINDVYTFMTPFIEKQGDIFIFNPKFIDVFRCDSICRIAHVCLSVTDTFLRVMEFLLVT